MTAISRTQSSGRDVTLITSGPCLSRGIAAALIILMVGCIRTAPTTPPSPPSQRVAKQTESSPNSMVNPPPAATATGVETTETYPLTGPGDWTAASKPQPVHRPDDQRPKHDDRRLAEAGIRLYESKRLKLYTDIDAEEARALPPVIGWTAARGQIEEGDA